MRTTTLAEADKSETNAGAPSATPHHSRHSTPVGEEFAQARAARRARLLTTREDAAKLRLPVLAADGQPRPRAHKIGLEPVGGAK